ncbi:FAD-dependent oxidoreductase [Paenibacillus oceani]|uniref:FAD-dependent oxidoreductase n=1 Tax=Paenibacillus oceani TaxID=2772510 RepID=A0A927H1K6_9BACL|nr:FAD-dependent oxidoreductase [Paenibacillus oceani]MBD2864438.1 FAD-dependent oxidoreductase [Paenibacillus oceani]
MTKFHTISYYKPAAVSGNPQNVRADVCIYGASSAGVAAAVQASRMGLKAVIVEFGSHIGGLTTGGLGATDIGNKAAIGGISREFYRAVGDYYGSDENGGTHWLFEPGLASRIYKEWLENAQIDVYTERHLQRVEKTGGRITRIVMENGDTFEAGMFIDATYEGDLMAMAGVSYHVGRESNSVYKETLNGIHFGHPNHNFKTWVDPYVVPGKPDSGLLNGVTDAAPGAQGQGDSSVQAYNFRICLTDDPASRLPFPKPPAYNPDDYTLLARYIESGIWDALKLHKRMSPTRKTDLNNFGAVSTDFIGRNYEWPDGDYATRERLFQEHYNYNLGLLYFLCNDERVPLSVRQEAGTWGLPADEYVHTGHWTPQLYIREARRMVAGVVMTEKHCRGYEVVPDSVGLAAYTMDSHNCRRLVIEGRCINEGNVETALSTPYPISYRSIVPLGEQCTNLLVPVCLSSSHIAFGSIRMEPVFMILGQSAATAAALALEAQCAVQDVDYGKLSSRLQQDGQILSWT